MMTESRTQHLTDAEFSRLLDGAQPGNATEAHLALCELCRGELETVRSSLTSFRTLGAVWAESAASRHLPLPARWMERFGLQTSWSAGLATTAMTGVLVFWMGFAPHTRQPAVVHAPMAAPTKAELAADNSLLLSIDDEVLDQTQPVLAEENMPAVSKHNAHHPVSTISD